MLMIQLGTTPDTRTWPRELVLMPLTGHRSGIPPATGRQLLSADGARRRIKGCGRLSQGAARRGANFRRNPEEARAAAEEFDLSHPSMGAKHGAKL
jgi:hypothetical protein